ncbi:Gp19/Gp15/Gp42 family protein [Bifidobacterium vansinderenii]|uniref:Phage protein Gp19/Gp15/Gp42 n=1 Tax=Bifidobacterium vansinderenii TaxID=1984871 RepID=A0A229W1B6_9BIFI|nr:Gp19/Gp15/Gp42 family protein [Bifidobacterium vansinderenii]OXN01653.1 phage protein Gp19/Gp15/Gp42 [Bifidobacterium vansinderenii]
MSKPFASVDELEAGWHTLNDEERARAQTLLARASRIIRADCPHWQRYEIRTPGLCADTCCEMVKRAMLADQNGAPAGVSQMNTTTGPFTDGYTFANPMGNLYMLDTEKRRLGAGAGRAFTLTMSRSGE